ncbi:hypothetical protein F4860DRAFT_464484 [Xylaria cubensis]|nr:hypothetical protein F4860DRAFT_464484 [Xylaria cubensis]
MSSTPVTMSTMSPTPPTGNAILVGRDPFTGIDPVWLTAHGNRPKPGTQYSGQLGPRAFLKPHSNTPTPTQFYIPNIAFFRKDVVSNIKRLLHESTGDEALQFGERDRRLWENPYQIGYTNDRLITWARPHKELQKASIFACPFPTLRVEHNDFYYDMVPAFDLPNLPPILHEMVENCLHAIRDHYPHITYRQFHYYMFLWAHYQLKEHTHHGRTLDRQDVPHLKQFVTEIPTVLDFTENTGSPFFPNLALATRRWCMYKNRLDDPVASNDPFNLLTDKLLDHFSGGEGFPTSGYLLPGDLIGSQNEPYYNSGHPNEFGGKFHAPTVRETVQAIGDVRRVLNQNALLVNRDVNTSEHRACMQLQIVNTWRRTAQPCETVWETLSKQEEEPPQPRKITMMVELFRLLPRYKTGEKLMSTIRDGHPCAICKQSMRLGTGIVVLECGHWADIVCMKRWLTQESSSCFECGHVTIHAPPSEPAASSSGSGALRPWEPRISAASSSELGFMSSEMAAKMEKYLDYLIDEAGKDGKTVKKLAWEVLFTVSLMKDMVNQNQDL